jgi:HK97 family phage prohead protease
VSWHQTEALGSVREVAGQPRTIEGIAVPYGVVSGETELGREVFAPSSFRASVEHWMTRQDGARMAFRPAHKMPPIGTVRSLEDTPEGVKFTAVIRETPAGDEYLADVRDGLNGISIEAGLPRESRRMRDGTVLHREAKLHAIAGSVNPAYDGARIALRDMEELMETPAPEPTPTPAPTPTPPPEPEPKPAERDAATRAVEPISSAERSAIERADPLVRQVAASRIVITRQEAVYSKRSEHHFLSDLQASHQGDSAAADRQRRHHALLTDIDVQIERAGDVLSTEVPGAYPNDYLPGLLTPRILKGRPMGGFYNRVPISDARPKIFAKVTTSSTVAVQSAEGANPAASDVATTAVTATPLLYGAETVVSRQVLDGGDPSAQDMILTDMIEAYAQASETVIKTAVEAGATASGTAITAATPFAGLLGNLIAYQAARFKPALGQFIPAALYAVALAQADTTGRPFLSTMGPTNAVGQIEAGGASAQLLDAKEFLSWASTTNVVVTGRPEDYVIYESSIARFSYDQATGPSAVRIGIWAYLVVGTRLGSLKVTAA